MGATNVLKDLRGIGITNQRETVVLWNKQTGKPLCPALVWNDGRTASIVKKIIEAKSTEDLDDCRVNYHNPKSCTG